jgi:virginiamycin B lyase
MEEPLFNPTNATSGAAGQAVLIDTLEPRQLFSLPGISVTVNTVAPGTNFPGNLTVTSNGNVWYTSALAAEIGYVSPDGTVAPAISTAAASSHGLSGLAVGKDGNVWFCEFWDNVIGEINPSGQITTYTLPNKFDPQSITLGPDGHLWVTTFDNVLGRINSVAGGKAKVSWFKHKGEGLQQIVSWNNGLYIQESNTIARVNKAGAFTGAFKTLHGGTVADLTVGPDGNLWFTENGKNGSTSDYVGYINKKGKVVEFAVSNSLGSLSGISGTGDGNLIFCQGEYLQEINTKGDIIASQDLGLASGASSVVMGTNGNVYFAEGVTGKIGLAAV